MRSPALNVSLLIIIFWLYDVTINGVIAVYIEPESNTGTRGEVGAVGAPTTGQDFVTPPNTEQYVAEPDQTVADPTIEDAGETWESVYNPDDLQMGCTELRSKRYISDGFCTSVRPITEVVCAGECLPVQLLPNYAMYQKVWSREKTREWRCVDDVIRYRNVNLLCQNGERRRYRIPTVRSCKCKRYDKRHNESIMSPNIRNHSSRSEPEPDQSPVERRSSRRRNNMNQ